MAAKASNSLNLIVGLLVPPGGAHRAEAADPGIDGAVHDALASLSER